MKPRPSLAAIAGLAMIAALSATGAAQSTIQLNAGPGQVVTFTGQGSTSRTIGVTLGACSWSGDCSLGGAGTGSGSLASSGTFNIRSSANSIVLTPNGGGSYTASASSPIYLTLTGSANGQSGTLLAGTLTLLNFVQTKSASQGRFNTSISANLNVTEGMLASWFGSDSAVLGLNVEFPCGGSLSGLTGTNRSLVSSLSASGAGGISPAPEPSTLALVGAGLLVLGVGLRIRHPHAEMPA
ncbi:MAG: PEP-CTERM sorting domain-containing protein [Acidobacteria bacterium]|nr:MAG: PEP-CTERM sorting domain-containing protein [Acidobacteriota bacterium]